MSEPHVRVRLEAAAPSREQVLSLLKFQADQFFGDLPYWLDGDVAFEVESYNLDTMQDQRKTHLRWAAVAHYTNYDATY